MGRRCRRTRPAGARYYEQADDKYRHDEPAPGGANPFGLRHKATNVGLIAPKAKQACEDIGRNAVRGFDDRSTSTFTRPDSSEVPHYGFAALSHLAVIGKVWTRSDIAGPRLCARQQPSRGEAHLPNMPPSTMAARSDQRA